MAELELQARLSMHVPQEVWLKIARHLSTEEWAQVSGVCKASWTLHLSNVNITDCQKSGAAGILWLMKRTHHLQRCHLILPAEDAKLHAMASHIMQAPELFSSLLTLGLDSRNYKGTCAVALLPCLLGRAHGLKFLSLRLQCTFWIPDLTHRQSTLQHLQIDSTGGTLSQLEPLLPKLQGLRTLCLKSDGWQPRSDRTKLRLQSLTQLQSIQLDNVMPR